MSETNPWDEPELAAKVRAVMDDLGVDELSARQIVLRNLGGPDGDVLGQQAL